MVPISVVEAEAETLLLSNQSHLKCGVLLAMMISLAFPWRSVFKVCL